jgi:SpoVK/Ycf46/Vps4 family AAA+-type ATPase
VVATNHIEAFDVAIKRPGRFDAILQVMPPTAEEKLRGWKDLSNLKADGISDEELREKLGPLTYVETEILVGQLAAASSAGERRARLAGAKLHCTLLTSRNPEEDPASLGEKAASKGDKQAQTWEDVCGHQAELSRVP